MKYLIFLVALFLSCAASNYKASYFSSLSEKEKKDIQCQIVFTDSLINDEIKKPLHEYHNFVVSENDSIYVYIKYFNLYRNTYFEKVNLMDSSGQIFKQFSTKRNYTDLSWNCWYWLIIKRFEYRDGLVKVRVCLNNEPLALDSFSLKINPKKQ